MRGFRINSGSLLAVKLGLSALLAAGSLSAAPVSYDFTTGGVNSNPGVRGNTVSFLDNTLSHTVELTSWYAPNNGSLATATGFVTGAPNVQGFGVCNSGEGAFATCTANGGAGSQRGLDNATGRDWVLLLFSQPVNLSSFTIFPDVGNTGTRSRDRDVTYFTGNIDAASELQNQNYAFLTGALGMTRRDVNFSSGRTSVTVNLTAQNGNQEVWGNAILIGASLANTGDRFFLSGMTAVVPVPPAIWLFGSALAVLLGRRRLF